jgi:hypothetical protein
MKKVLIALIVVLGSATIAAAQSGYSPSTDVLGAHLNYGRGCAACHAPHSGASGNGIKKSGDLTTGNIALWGEDVATSTTKLSKLAAAATPRPCQPASPPPRPMLLGF